MVSAPPPAPTWGDDFNRRRLIDSLTDTVAIVATAARLLRRHWPALLALVLAGVIGRELAVRLAVPASAVSGELGMLVLVLAPLATLTSWVLMLRVVQSSLPGPAPAGARASVLNHIGSALVPFLAVYQTYGYLTEDMRDYAYRVFEAEVLRNPGLVTGPGATDVLARLPLDLDLVNVVVVTVAITLRWLLARWRATETRPWLGIPGAYLEAVWITLAVSMSYHTLRDTVTEWLTTRRMVHWAQNLWHESLSQLGWFSDPVQGVTGWIREQIGDGQEVLGVPLAWLAIAAVVLGYGELQEASPAPAGTAVVPRPARRAARVVPPRLRRLLWQLLGVRFAPLLRSMRTLLTAGIRPVLVFCLAFAVAGTLADWLWELQRWLIGPQDLDTVWIPLAWPLATLNESIGRTLLICLVAAAVNRTLGRLAAPGRQPAQAGSSHA